MSPRRRRVRRTAALAAIAAAALPAAAFAASISGTDGDVINPANQSPDYVISSPDSFPQWQVTDADAIQRQTGIGTVVELDNLDEGVYTLWATDSEGTAARVFVVDTTPPAAPSVSSPASGADYTVGQSVTASYTCPGGATCSPPNGTAVDTSSPGSKTFTVTATDQAGNQTSVDVDYTVSNAPPVDDEAPTGGSLSVPAVTTTATIAVTAGASTDPSGPIRYALEQGNAIPAAGDYGAPGVLPTSFSLSGLDGTKVVRLWAKDAVGNVGNVAVDTVVLDRGGPAIGIAKPDPGATYALGSVQLADYDCADGVSGVASCAGPVADGAAIDTSSVGTKSFTVTATDNAGNVSSESVTYHVGDNVDPTVAIESPKAQKYEVNTVQLASFSCDDNAPGPVSCAGTVPIGNPIDTSTLGEHIFVVQATDASGNQTTKQVVYQVVDTLDPEAAGLVSPPDSTVTNQLRPKLNWTAATDPGPGGAPGSGIAAYEVLLDGKQVASVGPGTTSWTADEDLNPGQHTWRVRAVDKAGNTTLSQLFGFRVDPNATPAPTFTAAPGAATNDNTPSFAWTGEGATQEYRWALKQGTDTLDQGVLGGGTPSLDLGPLADGDYVFTVTQRTNGNHGTAAAHAFTVDTVAPGALTIVVRPVGASDDTTPLFAWAGGEPDARYLWQLTGPGGVIVQGPVVTTLNAALLSVAAGSYVFQVRQVDAAGNPSPLTIPEPFTVVGGTQPPPPPGPGTPNEPTAPAPDVKKATKTVTQNRPVPTVRNAKALTPRAGARITSTRPVLRWRARKGATLYNVQVFRLKNTKLTKVVTAFPRGTTFKVPKGKLAAGYRYVWRVWPYVNRRFPSQPLGVSYFDVRQTAKSLARSRILAPTATSLRAGRSMTVRWRAKSGSAAYKLQVLRGATVAFEQVSAERSVVVPASALAAKGTVRVRILAGVGASDTAFAAAAWAQADLKLR